MANQLNLRESLLCVQFHGPQVKQLPRTIPDEGCGNFETTMSELLPTSTSWSSTQGRCSEDWRCVPGKRQAYVPWSHEKLSRLWSAFRRKIENRLAILVVWSLLSTLGVSSTSARDGDLLRCRSRTNRSHRFAVYGVLTECQVLF